MHPPKPNQTQTALKKHRFKKHRLKKRYCLGIAGLLFILSGLLSQPRWIFTLANHLFPGALYAIDRPPVAADSTDNYSGKRIALTIDDGPSPVTAEILAVLDQHNAKATFFNISSHIPGHEAVVQQAVDAGHEIGNHFTTDYPSIRFSPEEFEADLLAAEQALLPFVQNTDADATLRWLRPGMGFYNSKMVDTAECHGYQVVLGSVFPYDTHIHASRFASAFIRHTATPGDIIVLHDGPKGRGDRTLKTLKTILPALQAQGYEITTVSQLASP